MASLSELGYAGLFLASFLAATVLPLSSELVLAALWAGGFSPLALVLVATTGNVLGSMVNYVLGYWLGYRVARRYRSSRNALLRAEKRFKRYGIWALFFAWVPVLGDPLTVVAGVLRVSLLGFLILVTAGKLCRYLAVVFLMGQVPEDVPVFGLSDILSLTESLSL